MKMLKMHQNALICIRMRMLKNNTTFVKKQQQSRKRSHVRASSHSLSCLTVAHSASYALCMPCLIHVLTIVVVPLLRTSEHIIVHFPGHAQARRELDHLHRRLEVLVTARAEGTGVRIGVYGGRRRCADWRASVWQRRHSLGQLFGRLGPSRPA